MRTLPSLPAWVWFGLALAVFAVHNATIQPWTLDDAFITFRYAENLAAGHGPVYNLGERVEGYTTFSWMALLAGARVLGFDVLLASKVLGALVSMGILALLAWLHRLVPGVDARIGGVSCLLVGASVIMNRGPSRAWRCPWSPS